MADKTYYVYGAGEGERHEARGSVMQFKATSLTTSGRLSLMERTLPPGGRMPPPHSHAGHEEAYFVLDGEVTFILDGNEHVQHKDDFVLVPAGTSHTFGNRSATASRLLVMHTPALDAYFVELEVLWAGAAAPTVEQERALMSRHGMEPA